MRPKQRASSGPACGGWRRTTESPLRSWRTHVSQGTRLRGGSTRLISMPLFAIYEQCTRRLQPICQATPSEWSMSRVTRATRITSSWTTLRRLPAVPIFAYLANQSICHVSDMFFHIYGWQLQTNRTCPHWLTEALMSHQLPCHHKHRQWGKHHHQNALRQPSSLSAWLPEMCRRSTEATKATEANSPMYENNSRPMGSTSWVYKNAEQKKVYLYTKMFCVSQEEETTDNLELKSGSTWHSHTSTSMESRATSPEETLLWSHEPLDICLSISSTSTLTFGCLPHMRHTAALPVLTGYNGGAICLKSWPIMSHETTLSWCWMPTLQQVLLMANMSFPRTTRRLPILNPSEIFWANMRSLLPPLLMYIKENKVHGLVLWMVHYTASTMFWSPAIGNHGAPSQRTWSIWILDIWATTRPRRSKWSGQVDRRVVIAVEHTEDTRSC